MFNKKMYQMFILVLALVGAGIETGLEARGGGGGGGRSGGGSRGGGGGRGGSRGGGSRMGASRSGGGARRSSGGSRMSGARRSSGSRTSGARRSGSGTRHAGGSKRSGQGRGSNRGKQGQRGNKGRRGQHGGKGRHNGRHGNRGYRHGHHGYNRVGPYGYGWGGGYWLAPWATLGLASLFVWGGYNYYRQPVVEVVTYPDYVDNQNLTYWTVQNDSQSDISLESDDDNVTLQAGESAKLFRKNGYSFTAYNALGDELQVKTSGHFVSIAQDDQGYMYYRSE